MTDHVISKRARVKRHLINRIPDDMPLYIKSRDIAGKIGLSPQQVGHYLLQLMEHDTDLAIRKWAKDPPVTWEIRKGPGGEKSATQ